MMAGIKHIEVMDEDFPEVYLYHWDTKDAIDRMKEIGVIISDGSDPNRFPTRHELEVEAVFNGMYNNLMYENLPHENFRLMRIDLYNTLMFERGSKCVLKETEYDNIGLVAEKGEKCVIRPEDIQVSQVFTAKQLRDNYGKNKIVLKFSA